MISKTALHALLAFAELARAAEDTYLGAVSIARKIGAPENYLGKLLKDLTRTELVVSQKGLGGGFRLGRDPRKISLFDVVEPIDQVSRWNGCFLGRASCSDDAPCQVHERWQIVRKAYLQFLKETSIADLSSKAVEIK